MLAFATMRIMIVLMLLAACGNGENAGVEAAKKQQAEEMKAAAHSTEAAKTITPPVAGGAHLDCASVINADLFTQALGETIPITLRTATNEPEAAASCDLLRGGKRLTAAEQAAQVKKNGKLGVMGGDPICNVSLFCWTIEAGDRFQKKCADTKDPNQRVDNSLGFAACLRIIPTGEDDVHNWRFFDEDTKCVIGVRAGPSNGDNAIIDKCAKAAHDLIGPDQIKVGAAPAAAPAGSGSGS